MLGLMAQSRVEHDVSGALPLPLPYLFTDPTSPLFHRHQVPHLSHSLLLQQYADSLLRDPIHRLALSRFPVPGSRIFPKNPRPLKSFCIKDILGQETDKDRHSRSSSSLSGVSPRSAYRTVIMPGSSRPLSCESLTCRLLSTVRAPSTSPSTPASTSGCPSPSDLFSLSSAVCGSGGRIVRPWLSDPFSFDTHISSDDGVEDSALDDDDDNDDEEINVDDEDPPCGKRADGGDGQVSPRGVSPLDALMAMASSTLNDLHSPHSAEARRREQQALLFSKHATPKKRRKSRTAFSNQQICQLEKRFLYQKYLTPADRDDIAHALGLSNSQVITWFQNRRAKLKRDLEELKNDVTAAKKLTVEKSVTGKSTDRHLHKVHHHNLHKPTKNARQERGVSGESSSPPSSSSSVSRPLPSSCCPAAPSRHSSVISGTLSPTASGGHTSNCSPQISDMNTVNNNAIDDHRLHSDDMDSVSSCEELVVIGTGDDCGSRQEDSVFTNQADAVNRCAADTDVSTLDSMSGTD